MPSRPLPLLRALAPMLRFLRGVAVLALLPLAARAQAWEPALAAQFKWHDNATNADRAADILPAAQFLTTLSASQRRLLTPRDQLLFTARFSIEAWPRYDGLDRLAPGLGLVWQRKFGLGAYAPALRAEFSAEHALARESGRSANTGTAALVFRQRLTSAFTAQLGHEFARTDARDLAFDRTGRETSARLGWQSPTPWHFELTLGYRRGDVLVYSSPPRPDLVKKGKIITFSETFDRQGPFIAYYFPADTRSLALRASRSLDRTTTLGISLELRRTPHGDVEYRNRLFALSLQRRL